MDLIADVDQIQAADVLLSLTYYDPERAWLEGILPRIIDDPEAEYVQHAAIVQFSGRDQPTRGHTANIMTGTYSGTAIRVAHVCGDV